MAFLARAAIATQAPAAPVRYQALSNDVTRRASRQDRGDRGAPPSRMGHGLGHCFSKHAIHAYAPAGTLMRQVGPNAEATREAQLADLLCDIPALCRIKRASPSVVEDERIRAVARRCRPRTLITMDPCLMPTFALPQVGLSPPVTGRGTQVPVSPGIDLGQFTTFRFSAGAASFTIQLPRSLLIALPLQIGGSRTIDMRLSAEVPGNFQFALAINGLPQVRISAGARVDVGRGVGSAELTVTTTRTVCRAADPARVRTAITEAGARLQTAINAHQSPAPIAPGTTPPGRLEHLQTIASAIGTIYSTVEKAKKPCEQVPVVTFGAGVQTPLFPGTSAAPGAPPPPTTAGVTATFHF